MKETTPWRELPIRDRNRTLREAEWHPECYLVALAETLSRREIELLLRLYDGKKLFPRWARLGRQEVKELLLNFQQSDGLPGFFDCAVCGQPCDGGDSENTTLEHDAPQADIVFDNLQNHLLTCLACNRFRGFRLSITAARAQRRRQGKDVNEEVAIWAVQRVRRMVILIMRLEALYEIWLAPNLPRLCERE